MPKARSRRPAIRAPSKKPQEPEPELDVPRVNLDMWPHRTGDPREVVFEFLHPEDVVGLRQRGYDPIQLRTLDIRNPQDVVVYNRHVLRGVIDGTINMSKERAEALELDMRHRGMLAKVNFNLSATVSQDSSIKEILQWDQSRHTIDNTTIVDPSEMRNFIRERKALPPQKPQRKVQRKKKKR